MSPRPLVPATSSQEGQKIAGRRQAFTLVELLLTIGILGVLTTVTIAAINPFEHLLDGHDIGRRLTARELKNALYQHLIDTGDMVAGIAEGEANAVPICRFGILHETCVNLDSLVPTYVGAIPVDPAESNPRHTGYAAYLSVGRYRVVALHTGKMPVAQVTAPQGPAAWWSFNEGAGTQAADRSGNGHVGTLTNMEADAWTANAAPLLEANPSALEFSPHDDYVQTVLADGLTVTEPGTVTVSAWIRPASGGGQGQGRIVDKGTHWSMTAYRGYSFSLYNGGQQAAALAASVRHANTAAMAVSQSDAIAYGEWQHVAFVYNAGGDKRIRLYLNGELLPLTTDTAGVGIVTDNDTTPIRIANYNGGTITTFDGGIDEVRIYLRALSDEEIGLLAMGY